MTKFYLGILETLANIYFGVVVVLVSKYLVNNFGEHYLEILLLFDLCPSRGSLQKSCPSSVIIEKTCLDFCLLFVFLTIPDSNLSPNGNCVF